MGTSLRKIRDEFEGQTTNEKFRKRFQNLGRQFPVLGQFATPEGLVRHQRSPMPSHEDKDAVLHALVLACRNGGRGARTAMPLIFLCMYPALAAVNQQVSQRHDSESDRAGDLCLSFFAEVQDWQPEKGNCVAGNLKKNTLRAIQRRKKKERNDHKRGQESAAGASECLNPEERGEASASHFWAFRASDGSPFSPDDIEMHCLHGWMTEELGLADRDAWILVLRGPCKSAWKEVGRRVGMQPESARKRCRNLRTSIRAHPEIEAGCPGLEARMCITRVEGERTLH